MSNVLSLVKQLARTIKYRPLPELIGQKITIHGLDSIASDVQHSLWPSLVDDCHWYITQESFLRGQIAKYGLLDLTFHAPNNILENDYQNGISLLKDLRLVSHTKEIKDESEEDKQITKALFDSSNEFKQMLKDIAENKNFLLLFLQTEPFRTTKERFKYTINSLPEGYFPREFIIEDAALTNLRIAWLWKHFYW